MNELKNGFLNQMLFCINGAIKIADTSWEKQQIQSIECISEAVQIHFVILNMNKDFIYL